MKEIIVKFHPRHFLQLSGRESGFCILCENQVYSNESDCYCCRECEFIFHEACATTLMESNLAINHLETHEHTLTFIRKPNSFKCDICRKVDKYKVMNMYTCLLCNFFVHKSCIYLPKFIKITLHSHPLFLTFQVSDGNTKCQVCNQEVVCGYGGYICTDKACDYKLHSYCATNSNVWDSKEISNYDQEDVSSSPSLEEVDDKTFRHFSHGHDLMRLDVNNEEGEEGRLCQACILPIDFDSFLKCKECDFSLHDACASLLRKMEHAVHRHPLVLEVKMMNIKDGFFNCSTCDREACGFMYRCCREECGFKIDAKCASFVEPFNHITHEHPLSLSLVDKWCRCQYCFSSRNLTKCRECNNFYLDFKCTLLPGMVKCKYDTHPLTLYFQSSWYLLGRTLWCDICEKLDYMKLFYICHDCDTYLHVECLLGKYPYMKPSHTIKVNGNEILIASNRLTRPICSTCHGICKDKLVFIKKRDGSCFCSIKCIPSSTANHIKLHYV